MPIKNLISFYINIRCYKHEIQYYYCDLLCKRWTLHQNPSNLNHMDRNDIRIK